MKKKNNNLSTLKKTTFIQIFCRSTSDQQHMKTCVSYCRGLLIFENVATLGKVVQKCITDVIRRNLISKQVTAVCDFLKHDHVCELKEHGDPAINTMRAVVGLADGIVDYDGEGFECDNCLKLLHVIEDIRAPVENLSTALYDVLTDCSNKFKLFIAHQHC